MQVDDPMETEVSQDTEENMEVDGANSPDRAAESLRINLEVVCTSEQAAAVPRFAIRLSIPDNTHQHQPDYQRSIPLNLSMQVDEPMET